MTVLVTGGAGFIGSHVAAALLERGDPVVILDNLDPFYDPAVKKRNLEGLKRLGSMRSVCADLREHDRVAALFSEYSPRAVVHLAALAGVRPSLRNPKRYCDVNVTGTSVLLEACREHRVVNFVFGSSSSVYGARSRVPFKEDDPVSHPISPYAATKRAGELLCHSYHHNSGSPVSCLRFFTVYGPRQRPEMAIHKFSQLILKGDTLPVFHEGESARDYTFVGDIVAGVLAALDRPRGFEIINLGNSEPVRLRHLISLLESRLEREARIELMPAQPGDVPITCADISKARELLAYVPRTSLEEGLDCFVEWFRRSAKA